MPVGDRTTQAVNIFDLLLLSVHSVPGSGTEQFEWRESRPCSEKVTRVLAVLIAEENLSNLTELVLLLQGSEESLKSSFTVVFNGSEYNFSPTFIDR